MIYSIALQKGGVGKTTTAINIGVGFFKLGHSCLIIDLDSQANATMSLGYDAPDTLSNTILEVLEGKENINNCILHSQYGVDIIPSKTLLSGFIITALLNPAKFPNPLFLLKKYISEIKFKYEYIIIDLPPELGFYTVSGLIASDAILIPLQCEARAIRGVNILLDSYENVKANQNPNLKIAGIIGTMFNRNTNISTTVLQEARKAFDGKIKVFDTVIYRTIKFSEADFYNTPAIIYSDNEQVQNYNELVKEIIENG